MQQYAVMLADVEGMDKKNAVDYLHGLYPHLSKKWFDRNYLHIKGLDPAGLHEILVYNDPTARKAINNVMREQVAA